MIIEVVGIYFKEEAEVDIEIRIEEEDSIAEVKNIPRRGKCFGCGGDVEKIILL
jgi:hypothetical protein